MKIVLRWCWKKLAEGAGPPTAEEAAKEESAIPIVTGILPPTAAMTPSPTQAAAQWAQHAYAFGFAA